MIDRRFHYPEMYQLLTWIKEHLIDNYLDQNTKTVLKAIQIDNPPSEVKKWLYDFEFNHKKRQEILNALT